MTQEDKELLLKDITARLLYGVFVEYDYGDGVKRVTKFHGNYLYLMMLGKLQWKDFKPYLRPMSSMTEDEKKELENIEEKYFGQALDKQIKECLSSSPKDESRKLEYFASSKIVDWLNAHHFDYHGLIEKGLAIEAPKDLYTKCTKNESEYDLFFADEEERFTEFKNKLVEIIKGYCSINENGEYTQSCLKDDSKELLDLARKEICLTCKEYSRGYQEGLKLGKQDALKDLPKWKYKKDSIPLIHDSFILNKYGCIAKSPSGAQVNGVYVLEIDKLVNLPKEE